MSAAATTTARHPICKIRTSSLMSWADKHPILKTTVSRSMEQLRQRPKTITTRTGRSKDSHFQVTNSTVNNKWEWAQGRSWMRCYPYLQSNTIMDPRLSILTEETRELTTKNSINNATKASVISQSTIATIFQGIRWLPLDTAPMKLQMPRGVYNCSRCGFHRESSRITQL